MSRSARYSSPSIGITLLVVLLAALLHSAATFASTGRTFFDTRNETPGAPDISKVTIAQEGDIVALDLKTFQGWVLHWNGTRYVNAKKIADPSRSLVGAGSCGFMFNLANFGWPTAIGLTMAVSNGSGSSGLNDVAPNVGEWSFPVEQQADSLELSFEPTRPVSGTTFAAVTPTLTLTDETVVKPSRVTCEATVAGVELSSVGGVGACRWRIPADATGKQLVITATAVYRGRTASYDPWRLRVG